MAGKQAPQYKRSWKNLLLNKRYQLRFTLFMVGLSAVLMSVLGLWVMKEANEATTVAMARVRGEACPKVPEVIEIPGETTDENAVPMNIDDAPAPAPETPAAAEPPPAPAPAAPTAARPTPSKVDPAHVAANNAQNDLLAVKALWCTDAECKPETAAPLQ